MERVTVIFRAELKLTIFSTTICRWLPKSVHISFVKKIIFSSSSEVYGEQKKFPIFENTDLTPKSNYGISKIVGEEYVKAYNKLYDIKFNICRFELL